MLVPLTFMMEMNKNVFYSGFILFSFFSFADLLILHIIHEENLGPLLFLAQFCFFLPGWPLAGCRFPGWWPQAERWRGKCMQIRRNFCGLHGRPRSKRSFLSFGLWLSVLDVIWVTSGYQVGKPTVKQPFDCILKLFKLLSEFSVFFKGWFSQ